MSLANRIIPCLDVDAGRVVKGVQFEGLVDAGDPVEVARRYDAHGADEIAFLDITASSDARDTILETVSAVAKEVFIPLTVGGGVRTLDDAKKLLRAGADKISINTAAVKRPQLIAETSKQFGAQCVVVAIDAKRENTKQRWQIYTHGGRQPTGLDAVKWATRAVELGAGELLVTSMDRDGTRKGFDIELLAAVTCAVNVPVIASGGVGELQHLADGILNGGADAVLAASIFHFGEHSIVDAKKFLAAQNISVRL